MNKYAKHSDFYIVRRIVPVLIFLMISIFYAGHANANNEGLIISDDDHCFPNSVTRQLNAELGIWTHSSSRNISRVQLGAACGPGGADAAPVFWIKVWSPNGLFWGQVSNKLLPNNGWYGWTYPSDGFKNIVWARISANNRDRLDVVLRSVFDNSSIEDIQVSQKMIRVPLPVVK